MKERKMEGQKERKRRKGRKKEKRRKDKRTEGKKGERIHPTQTFTIRTS
jgi:hypothetical protein